MTRICRTLDSDNLGRFQLSRIELELTQAGIPCQRVRGGMGNPLWLEIAVEHEGRAVQIAHKIRTGASLPDNWQGQDAERYSAEQRAVWNG